MKEPRDSYTWPDALVTIALICALVYLMAACTMTRGPVTKQAPKPPYAGEMHGGMDGAVYLRVEEALDELRI